MHKIRHRGGIEAKALLRDHGNETRAGLERWIVKLSIALVALEVRGISGRQKRAFMMIEPPCNLGRARVLEVDDGVLVSGEIRFVEQRSRAMQQAGKDELGIFANPLAIEAGKKRRRRGSVETFIVVKDSDFQCTPQLNKNPRHRRAASGTFRRSR